MKTSILVLFISVMLLLGCTQQGGQPSGGAPPGQTPGGTPGGQPPENQTPPQNQTPANQTPPQNQTPTPPANQTPQPPSQPATVDLSQIYRYQSIHSYEYSVKTGDIAINMKTSLSSDTVNGTAAWLQQTEITTEGAVVTSKTWIDKQTYRCLKVTSIINYAGQTIEQPGTCPTTGPNTASQTEMPKATYIGKESVTVPAGTFLCDKYSLEETTFWVASNVPVPVKITYDSTVTELVSYT